MVFYCDNNRTILCENQSIGKVDNNIVAFANLDFTVRNCDIIFIGYRNNICIFNIFSFISDCTVIIACITLIIWNFKLSVFIRFTCSIVAV